MGSFAQPILVGLASGLQFDPVAAVAGSALAAALTGSRVPRQRRTWTSVAVVVAVWLAADGARVAFTAVRGAATAGGWAALAVWALSALLVGYTLPCVVGAYVGRQVTRGTGWLSAIVVAVMVCGALVQAAPAMSKALEQAAMRL